MDYDEDGLLDVGPVTGDRRQVSRDVLDERDARARPPLRVENRPHDVLEEHGLRLERKATRLRPAQDEQVLDEPVQPLRFGLDVA